MKNLLFSLATVLILTGFVSCSYESIRGNGTITKNEIKISDYEEIDFGGDADIVYEQKIGVEPYLRIEIDENLFPILEVNSDGKVLSVKETQNINPTAYKIYTNSTMLTQVNSSGSVGFHLKGKLETPAIRLSISGSGDVVGDEIVTSSIAVSVSGSGSITLAGTTGSLESSISGSGKTDAFNMVADTVFSKISGSGKFSGYANKYIKLEISGSGSAQYKGNPKVDESISGSGSITRIN